MSLLIFRSQSDFIHEGNLVYMHSKACNWQLHGHTLARINCIHAFIHDYKVVIFVPGVWRLSVLSAGLSLQDDKKTLQQQHARICCQLIDCLKHLILVPISLWRSQKILCNNEIIFRFISYTVTWIGQRDCVWIQYINYIDKSRRSLVDVTIHIKTQNR